MTLENLTEGHLRVAVADDEPFLLMYLEETVQMLGHDVVVVARDGQELVEKCLETRPDIIVSDVKMPQLDGLSAVRVISRAAPLPAVLLTGYGHLEVLIKAEMRCIVAYLIKPIDELGLRRGISLALLRYRQFQTLLQDEGDLEAALSGRKIVEQAKAALIQGDGLEEAHAFDVLVHSARQRNQRITEAAHALLAVHDEDDLPPRSTLRQLGSHRPA